MTPPLESLRDLKPEPPDDAEIAGLLSLARSHLRDAHLVNLSAESRFTLAYGAAHAISFAALRRRGFRTDKRYMVFQLLPQTMGAGPEIWRVLDKAHEKRNLLEYEGATDIEPQLIADTLAAAEILVDIWEAY